MLGAPSSGLRSTPGAEKPTIATVYQAHAQQVARWAARLGGPNAEVEDILQEVFFIAHRKLPLFRGDSQIATWLFAITRNVVRQRGQRERVRRLLLSMMSRQSPELALRSTPLDAIERRESLEIVYRALEGLPENHRTAFILFEIEGLSGREAADLTRANVSTLRVWLMRARAHFMKRMAMLENAARSEATVGHG